MSSANANSQVAPVAIERFVPPIARWVDDEVRAESDWIEKLAEDSLRILRDAGFAATLHITAGNPKQILVKEAEKWHADSFSSGQILSPAALKYFCSAACRRRWRHGRIVRSK